MKFKILSSVVLTLSAGFAPSAVSVELPRLDSYDVRLTDEKTAATWRAQRTAEIGLQTEEASVVDSRMGDALDAIKATVPGLYVLESAEVGAPEVIGVSSGGARLSSRSTSSRVEATRAFLEQHSWLFGLSPAQAAALEVEADYTNPSANLSWVRMRQRIGGLDVFRGFTTLAFTPAGEIARITGQLAAGVPEDLAPPSPQLTARDAVAAGAATIGVTVDPESLMAVDGDLPPSRFLFQRGPFARSTDVELIYFPLGRGVVELSWMMTLWGVGDSYLIVVSADDGTLLFRKNITDYDSYSYSVYTSDSPAPLSPGGDDPTNPTFGTIVPRDLVAVESQASTNDPWLPPGLADANKVTDGNNVEAGVDLDSIDGVDAPVPASNPASNTFSYSYNPAPGDPAPGTDPTLPDFRQGAVVNLFYWVNRFHDLTYDLGFTELAFNFQHDNYGRGGLGGDRVSAEAQDSNGTNNANFSTPADGGRGRMQMYRWTIPTPDRDGDLDAEIILHELAHGLSNRLHGNATGLSSNMSRCMGEGWSDFYAQSMLSEPTDPVEGVYAMGGYGTLDLSPASYYYGIRGFPKAVMSFTGGPGDLPHNPLTFADIDQTQFATADGAYPRLAASHISTTADQVHAGGEVWSTALWEARGLLIQRLGHPLGNQTMLQLVTDGMKLDPANPTFLDARDAILAADCASFGGANEADLWAGFALRGMGYSARVISPGSGGGTARVSEAFDTPTLPPVGEVTVAGSGCVAKTIDGGTLNPGETVILAVPLVNPLCGTPMTGVSAQIVGGTSASYGSIAPGATVSRDLSYTIPEGTCGDLLQLELLLTSDLGSTQTFLPLQVGPTAIAETTFTNSATVDVPAGQPATTTGPATPYPSVIAVSGITRPVVGVTVTLHQLSHEWVGDVDIMLEAPNGQKVIVLSDAWSSSNDPPVVATLRFADDAVDVPTTSGVPPANGAFRPVNHGAGDTWAAPAPAGPYSDPPLSTFAGIADPNGDWKLWIVDDASSDPGQLLGGWSLGVLTTEPVSCTPCSLLFGDGFESGDSSAWSAAVP